MLEINEGNANNYLVHGIFTMFGTLILVILSVNYSIFLFIPSALLFTLAVLLFTASNGLELDKTTNRYRKYGKIGLWKFGAWHKHEIPNAILLALHSTNEHRGSSPVIGHIVTLDTKVITYDISFVHTEGSQVIYEFLNYKLAKQALHFVGEQYNIPITNKIAEKLKENQVKRRRS